MIIGDKKENLVNMGGKGYSLFNLKKSLNVPTFFVVPKDVFKKHLKQSPELYKMVLDNNLDAKKRKIIREKILNTKIDKDILYDLKDKIKKLKLGNDLIVRSSFSKEDSREKSYAGIFNSYRTNKNNLEKNIKLVWMSLFEDRLSSYNNKKIDPFGMAVVVQKFIKGEYSGVIFYQKNNIPEIYIEYSKESYSSVVDGTITPSFAFKITEEKEVDFYYSNNENEENRAWLNKTSDTLLPYFEKNKKTSADMEFTVKNGEIYYLQERPLGKNVQLEGSQFYFDRNHRWNYHTEDFSQKEIDSIFRKIGLNSFLKFNIKNNNIFLETGTFVVFIEEINKRAKDPVFVENFIKYFSELKAKEWEKSERDNLDLLGAIKVLKKNRFKISIVDFIHTQIRLALLSYLEKKYNLKKSFENLSLLSPPVSFAVEKLLTQSDEHQEDTRISERADLKKIKKKVLQNEQKIISELEKMKPSKRKYFLVYKKLVWLRDFVDYYHDKSEINYFKNIVVLLDKNNFKKLSNNNLSRITLLDKKTLHSFLKNKELTIFKSKKPKLIKQKISFPLQGVVASPGDFSGIVKIIKGPQDIKKISKKNILVAKYTKPSLVEAMAIAKGIITECGGLASHAAIVSREFAKPCVVSVVGCFSSLKDGDKILVKKGKIYKM